MRTMLYDKVKLQRLLDRAEETHDALMSVSDRLSEVRRSRTSLQTKIDKDVKKYGRSNAGDARNLADTNEELQRLTARHDRLQQQWHDRNAVASSCEDWARTHADRRGDGSVLRYPGPGGWIR